MSFWVSNSKLTCTGGDRITPGDGGGMELPELWLGLDEMESTLEKVLLVGVVGTADESESLLLLSCFGEADSSRWYLTWFEIVFGFETS